MSFSFLKNIARLKQSVSTLVVTLASTAIFAAAMVSNPVFAQDKPAAKAAETKPATKSVAKPAAKAAEAKPAAAPMTQTQKLEAALAACDKGNFAKKEYCKSKARFKNCKGLTETVEACKAPKANNA